MRLVTGALLAGVLTLLTCWPYVPMQTASADAKAGADAGAATSAQKTGDGTTLAPELLPQLDLAIAPGKEIHTGDLIKVRLTVRAKPEITVAVPDQSFGKLELLDRRVRTEPSSQGRTHVFELDLLALSAGEYTLPALTVRAVGSNGEVADLHTDARPIVVLSRIANEPNAAPKPPSDPVVVEQDDYTILWVLGILLGITVVAAATLVLARFLRRKPKPAPPSPPPRPPWDLAMEKLLKLQDSRDALLKDGRGEEYIDGVSDTLREYLGRRFGFDGLESTTDELLQTLNRLRPARLSLSGVSLLLEQCDLVKFARMTPDRTMCDDLWNGAHGLIHATTPEPASQESEST